MPEKAVVYAVLAADDTEAILYHHLCFETELQDCISSPRNKDYMEKVYKLVTFCWKELIPQITSKTVEIFQMRERTESCGSDTVYDAWLLANNLQRSAFSQRKFNRIYPFWKTTRQSLIEDEQNSNTSEEEETEKDSPSQSLLLNQQVLPSGVSEEENVEEKYCVKERVRLEAAQVIETIITVAVKRNKEHLYGHHYIRFRWIFVTFLY